MIDESRGILGHVVASSNGSRFPELNRVVSEIRGVDSVPRSLVASYVEDLRRASLIDLERQGSGYPNIVKATTFGVFAHEIFGVMMGKIEELRMQEQVRKLVDSIPDGMEGRVIGDLYRRHAASQDEFPQEPQS